MGVSESKTSSCDKPMAVVNPMTVVDLTDSEEQQQQQPQQQDQRQNIPRSNVSLQLFEFRQQMGLKQHSTIKWASSKLLLTEELLKQQEHKEKQMHQSVTVALDDFDSDAAWAEQQLAMLTDDEDDDIINSENRAPLTAPMNHELNNLMNYRVKLRNTILHLAQEKLRKREKTKVKRLKRRTLISSKKPSSKDKHRNNSFY